MRCHLSLLLKMLCEKLFKRIGVPFVNAHRLLSLVTVIKQDEERIRAASIANGQMRKLLHAFTLYERYTHIMMNI